METRRELIEQLWKEIVAKNPDISTMEAKRIATEHANAIITARAEEAPAPRRVGRPPFGTPYKPPPSLR